MIDVSEKSKTLRTARAEAVVKLSPESVDRIRGKKIPKGDPLETAKVAAIQAAKNTGALIPYCHPITLEHVAVLFSLEKDRVRVEATVKAIQRTGVEMEALTAASVAALTIYDMVKAFDREGEILGIRLLEKKGGRSEYRSVERPGIRAAVVVISDSAHRGEREDATGPMIRERLEIEGVEVREYVILPDDQAGIAQKLRQFGEAKNLDLVLTTGGTGLGPRDHAPEALLEVADKEVPGIPEALRAFGQDRTPFSMLSRGRAGLLGKTLIVNLPGSKRAVAECLDALFPGILHSFAMIRGEGHPTGRDRGGKAS